MSDSIDRVAVLEDLEKRMADDYVDAARFAEYIRTLPSAQPERKKGKWIEQDDGWDGIYYECSECKEAFTLIDGTPTDNLYNFCPNCGADMRGER